MSDTTLRVAVAAGLVLAGCDPTSDAEPRFPAPDDTEPFWLSQTGLYSEPATQTLAADLIEYEPTYALWSDAADKRRFMRLPRGTRIDTSDMDHWVFPVGTMFWKEFAHDGKPLETRLIARVGDGPRDYFMGAFVWNEEGSDARYVPGGMPNVLGAAHDVPSSKECGNCHNGEPGRILGASAVQLGQLVDYSPDEPYRAPGDDAAARALGYLHANCGHCHNTNGLAWPDTGMDLRLRVAEDTLETTAIYRSTVDIEMTDTKLRKQRIVTGDPNASGVYHRMSQRGPKTQMPPIATEQVDEEGLASVEAFILSL